MNMNDFCLLVCGWKHDISNYAKLRHFNFTPSYRNNQSSWETFISQVEWLYIYIYLKNDHFNVGNIILFEGHLRILECLLKY